MDLNRFGDSSCVTFSLNGEVQKVSRQAASTSLLQYLRGETLLRGTRASCAEGGCGACLVNVVFTDVASGLERSVSVNSCLLPLYSCHGMSVTTVEGVGNSRRGFHPVQTRMAHFCATGCGYCTPGWVVAMFSLLKNNKNMTMKEIEDSLGSNNCRCTGYRSILDACKSFADDSTDSLQGKVVDIEDILQKNSCFMDHKSCKLICEEDDDESFERDFVELALSPNKLSVHIGDSSTWYRVESLREIFEIFTMIEDNDNYKLVGGNTAQGVYEDKYPDPPRIYIDVTGVKELRSHWLEGDALVVGANVTMSDAIKLFRAVAAERPAGFTYLNALADHVETVAHIPVRNVGTLAGNLCIKHACPRFPSDLFTIFESVKAQLIVVAENDFVTHVTLTEFLETNMTKKVIAQIVFYPLDTTTHAVKTYKVSRRAQNDHAIVNAGFCFGFDKSNSFRVMNRPNIVFGGIRPNFIHAVRTEEYLEGKHLLNTKTLQEALAIMDLEVCPDRVLPESSEDYRKGLAFSLFYRFVLSLSPSSVNSRLQSGGQIISRPLSSGKQEYHSDPQEYPLTQPVPKLDALLQCSGELAFAGDRLVFKGEVSAALVLTDRGPARLDSIDAEPALKIPGVIAFYSAKDIPGVNTYVEKLLPIIIEYEELFASVVVKCAGQCVGMVVAVDQEVANFAAQRVVVKYKDERKPLLSIEDVIKSGEKNNRSKYVGEIKSTTKKGDVVHVIKGSFASRGQYDNYCETQTCTADVKDGGTLEVVASTQWMQGVQESISTMLGVTSNKISVEARQCGGGAFGGKASRANLPSCAAALAAYLLQRPVRIALPQQVDMRLVGGRGDIRNEYEVGVDSDGVIQYMNGLFYADQGVSLNVSISASDTIVQYSNVYDSTTWNVTFYDVLTDKNVTPGPFGSVGAIEHIMEHIAWTVKKDPLSVRLKNLAADQTTATTVKAYVDELVLRADYKCRLDSCRDYNKVNKWKKRGISLVPIKFYAEFRGVFHTFVSIFRLDGTVSISHGASEFGQGVNTKVAQVVAYELQIPLELIHVEPSNNMVSANDIFSDDSTSVDAVCFAAGECCRELVSRLAPVRAALPPASPWLAVVQAAAAQELDLGATHMFKPGDKTNYASYGATVLEVEIDCLTGEHKIVRADILQNVGDGVSPLIDIGQIEGAFLRGIGHYLSELLIYKPDTGVLLTDRSKEYKIPGPKDIPVDWRVYLKKDPNSVPTGAYGSKSGSEAPLQLAVSILFAVRRAIESLRREVGQPDEFFRIEAPCTTESIFLESGIKYKDFTL